MSSTAFSPEQYDVYPDGVHQGFWHASRNALIRKQLVARGAVAGQSTILDVGCARGVTVFALRECGFHAFGCDLGDAVPYAAEIAPFLFHGTDFRNLDPALKRAVTHVLLLDVLEHMEDPHRFLADLRRELPNATAFIVTLPARMELWSNYDVYYGHFKRYELADARDLAGSNFKVVFSRYFFHALYLAMALQHVIRKERSLLLNKKPSMLPLQRLISWCFVAELHWVPGSFFGSSIMLVLEPAHA